MRMQAHCDNPNQQSITVGPRESITDAQPLAWAEHSLVSPNRQSYEILASPDELTFRLDLLRQAQLTCRTAMR